LTCVWQLFALAEPCHPDEKADLMVWVAHWPALSEVEWASRVLAKASRLRALSFYNCYAHPVSFHNRKLFRWDAEPTRETHALPKLTKARAVAFAYWQIERTTARIMSLFARNLITLPVVFVRFKRISSGCFSPALRLLCSKGQVSEVPWSYFEAENFNSNFSPRSALSPSSPPHRTPGHLAAPLARSLGGLDNISDPIVGVGVF